jgi:hypothetical protein
VTGAGTLLGAATPCPWNGAYFCGRCCRRVGAGDAGLAFTATDLRLAPARRVDLADLGPVPPFRLVP